MPETKFKGVKIHYTDRGKGPAVVLLHGFLENSSMWDTLVPVFSRKHRVVCVDLPGHGQSECIGYVHTMDEMAEAVYKVISLLKLRRVTLIGHSMGGYVALAFAEFYPDHVKQLVIYQSSALSDDPARKKARNQAIDLVKSNHLSFIRKSIPQLFRPVNRQRFKKEVERAKEEALKIPVQGIIAALGGMRDRPNREILLKFPPYPVHVVAADKDPRIPYAESAALANISEHVRLHTIKGSGHMSYIEAPERTLEVFLDILAERD